MFVELYFFYEYDIEVYRKTDNLGYSLDTFQIIVL